MEKILIIGQAPPMQTQTVPYDTTLLYEMLGWVGISKEDAQNLFDFEAVSNEFPGLNKNGGHKPPSLRSMYEHWDKTLYAKWAKSNRIIILGEVARNFIFKFGKPLTRLDQNVVCLIHPSKRNYSKIMSSKESIKKSLEQILK